MLVDYEIHEWAVNGGVTPLITKHINPSSIDLCVNNTWSDIKYPNIIHTSDTIKIHAITLSTLINNAIVDFIFKLTSNKSILDFRHPTAVLVSTIEFLHIPDDMAGFIQLKTTPSREGLDHPIAGWVDNGFNGQLTLILNATNTIELHYKERICQLILVKTEKAKISYSKTGHYQNQAGPTKSWRYKNV